MAQKSTNDENEDSRWHAFLHRCGVSTAGLDPFAINSLRRTESYAEVANTIGKPNATRAVARACASNRIAVAIPCHRVIGKDGKARGYRWGVERKKKLLGMEKSAAANA